MRLDLKSSVIETEMEIDSSIQRKDISNLDGRDLDDASAWLGDETKTYLDLASKDEKWNQFDVNKKLFNVCR